MRKNDGLEQLSKQKKETIERWKNFGLLEDIEGKVKGNAAQLFGSYLIQFINNKEITELNSIIDAITECCKLLQSINVSECNEIIDKDKLHNINMQLSEWAYNLNNKLNKT